jgi:hypothetical protein
MLTSSGSWRAAGRRSNGAPGLTYVGSFAVTFVPKEWNCSALANGPCSALQGWSSVGQLGPALCQGAAYKAVGSLGFCAGGENSTPSETRGMGLVTWLGTSATALMLAASLLSIFGSAEHERTLMVGLGTLCAVAAVCTGAAAVAMMSSDPWYESLRRGNGTLPIAAISQGKSTVVLQAAGPVLLARSAHWMITAVAIAVVATMMLVVDLCLPGSPADSTSFNDPLIDGGSYGAGVPDLHYTGASSSCSSGGGGGSIGGASTFKGGPPAAPQPAERSAREDDPATLWPARGSRRQDGSDGAPGLTVA